MSSLETLTQILLIVTIAGFAYLFHYYNVELAERVNNLENMIKEHERDGVVYGRYLAKISSADLKKDD